MTDTSADLVILGGGSGGYAAAFRAAELGLSVTLIEKDKLGGTCLHRGCIPTKALLHAAEIADQSRESEQFGVRTSFDGIDMPGVNTYKDGVVARLYKGLQGLVKSRKITYVEGIGRLAGPTSVEVDGTSYEGRHIVLATGSVPKSLPGLDIDGERIITSDHALRLESVPASVVILGGGVIGCEFASVWKSFGAEVTIVEALPHLVPLEDEAASKMLERAFRKRKIGFELGSRFAGVEKTETGIRVSPTQARPPHTPSVLTTATPRPAVRSRRRWATVWTSTVRRVLSASESGSLASCIRRRSASSSVVPLLGDMRPT